LLTNWNNNSSPTSSVVNFFQTLKALRPREEETKKELKEKKGTTPFSVYSSLWKISMATSKNLVKMPLNIKIFL
jgi:hypothetical protein